LITLIDGAARQWKFTISPASVSRTRTLWMSWIAPWAARRDSVALMVSTRSGAASVPSGSSGSSG
jgi:hypothetical protein